MRVLVTGGAGYIGAHICKQLAKEGHEPVVFDNLSTGHVDFILWGCECLGSITEIHSIEYALGSYRKFDAVIHCAALAVVDESIEFQNYFNTNVIGTFNVLKCMKKYGVRKIVYLSTASRDSHYSETKEMGERIIKRFPEITYSILRLHNVAGASPDGDIGERHEPETHLIPNCCLVASGQKEKLVIHGSGNSKRSYVHVMDVAEEAVKALLNEESSQYDVFTNMGVSVKTVVQEVEAVTGKKIPVEYGPERAGEYEPMGVPLLTPRRTLTQIIADAYRWHCL